MVPRGRAQAVLRRSSPVIDPIVTAVLLPVHFVLSGRRVPVSARKRLGWPLGLIGVAAIGGNAAGVLLPARLQSMCWRDALILAILFDARGLTESLVLSLGCNGTSSRRANSRS